MSLPEDVLEKHRTVAAEAIPEDEYGHLVGGEWVASESGETAATTDATTGEELARFQQGSKEDVNRAVAAAQDAFEGSWGEKTPQQRAELLHEIADELEAEKTRIARLDSLEVGKPNKHSLFVDTTILIDQFRHFASLARTADEGRVPPSGDDKLIHTRQEPYGVVGCISAWNFPAMFVAWKLGPALAAGNSVVYKPSSRAVLSTLEIAKIVDRVLPPGALNVVTGAGSVVGDAITGHEGVGKVSLTGSTAAGQAAMRNAAEHIHPVSLELGGKSPNIVFPDADLEEAVEGTLVSIFFNQGQQCTAGSRLFLHEDVREEFLERFAARVEELTVGDPLSPLTDIGPMVDSDHRAEVEDHVETATSEGASVLLEKPVPDELAEAPFVPPVVFGDVADDSQLSCDEVFGPVLAVFEFESQDEVVERANDTEYGLAAGVWTSDLNTAHEVSRDLEAGMVWVNTYNDMFEPAPYGGYKQSGIGRELAVEAMAAYQQTKTVKMSFGDIPNLG
ncbi:aldehyde dehydrogenase family protein [Haloarchaeobius amylolyticus]|uniref:aldehyde dehydrogenase family protein n=1 Tax=Haloarchaeobius amylolyticus TaxID=1198296 RepID=UPI00226D6A30|nr:aldehyde dehydrogenase family protein [Haloarchaeobius amylolyticus]